MTLIGHSTGGFAALAVAAHAPGLARRVVSIAGFAHGQWTGALGLQQRLVRLGPVGAAVFKAMYKLLGITPGLFQWGWRIYVADARAFYAHPALKASLDNSYQPFKQLDLDQGRLRAGGAAKMG